MWLRILLAFVVSAATATSAQRMGRITGTVLDEQGRVVEDSTVCLTFTTGNGSATINCKFSISHGRFEIPQVGFGTYEVFAINEAEGYSIQNQSPGQSVTVSSANTSPDVTVRLHSGGPVLSGTVRDKATGKPVKGIWVRYIDVDGKASGGSPSPTDGEFHVALPTNDDLVIIVSAKGYRGWVYTSALDADRPILRLAAGERKHLDIQLEPDGKE